ncbi:MAG: hypothetical protein JNL70_21870 [Saprospiraceae bacterium]|nr:hypothetical protein [Saprospiraceae bacterium]
MKLDRMKDLIEKYFAGETSLEEEKILRGYFSSPDIDPSLRKYQPLFQFFEVEKDVVFDADKLPKFQETKTVSLQPQVGTQSKGLFARKGGQFWKIAAAVAFLAIASVSIFKVFEPKPIEIAHKGKAKVIILDENDNPEEALKQVNDALALVSKKMKKGKDKTNESLLKLRNATEILNHEN